MRTWKRMREEKQLVTHRKKETGKELAGLVTSKWSVCLFTEIRNNSGFAIWNDPVESES